MRRRVLVLIALLALGPVALAGQSEPMPLSPELEALDVAALEALAADGRGAERVTALTRLAALGAHAEPTAALERALEAAALARGAGDRRGEMWARYMAGYIRRNLAAYPEAVDDIEASIALADELGDERALANGHELLALTLSRVGQLDDALTAQLEAFAIREELRDGEGLAYSHNNLGNAFRRLGDYRRAIEHHRQAIVLKQELGLRGSLAYSHENLGDVYRSMGEWDQALDSYERSRQIHREFDDPAGLASVLTGIGIVRQLQDDPAAALELFAQALDLWQSAGDAHGEAVARLNQGRAEAALGRYERADTELQLALATFARVDVPLRTVETLDALSDLEAARGRPDEALAYLRRARAERHSTTATDVARRLSAARAERRRTVDLEVRRRERNTLALVALLSLALTGVAFYGYRQRRLSEKHQRAKAEALEKAMSETRTLRGLLPICASCKKIRDDAGYWEQIETYIHAHSEAEFTHGLCPDCASRYFPDDEDEDARARGKPGRGSEPPAVPRA